MCISNTFTVTDSNVILISCIDRCLSMYSHVIPPQLISAKLISTASKCTATSAHPLQICMKVCANQDHAVSKYPPSCAYLWFHRISIKKGEPVKTKLRLFTIRSVPKNSSTKKKSPTKTNAKMHAKHHLPSDLSAKSKSNQRLVIRYQYQCTKEKKAKMYNYVLKYCPFPNIRFA